MPRIASVHRGLVITAGLVAATAIALTLLPGCNAFLEDFVYVDANLPGEDGSSGSDASGDGTTAASDANDDGEAGPSAEAGSGDDDGSTIGYRAAVLATGPAAYWRLGEQIGPDAFSVTGGGMYTATYRGEVTLGVPGAIVGDPDTAIHVDGRDENPASVIFNGSLGGSAQGFAIELWMRPTVAASGTYEFLVKSAEQETEVDLVYQQASGSALDGVEFVDSVGAYAHSTTDPFVSTWNYVVFQSDGVDLVLYLNAKQVATTAVAPATDAGADAGLGFFAIAGDENGFSTFVGDIDEVAVYPAPLKPATILRHYNLAGAHDAGS